MSEIIGTRIKASRKRRGLSQDELARLFGFKDRQTVSAIETGARGVSATELLLAAEKLNESLEYFTDPFGLDGEAHFSWRQSGIGHRELAEYERKASQWLGSYRALAAQTGRPAPLMRRTLGLTKASRFEDAIRAGERFANEFGLGGIPARRLAATMQEDLGILVLLVDSYRGISGAACRLPELDAVLIARNEVRGRRNFDLAHELFHILTWDAMPPEHIEDARDFGGNRVEQLANNFAAAILMPREVLEPYGTWDKLETSELIARLNAVASELEVSSSALRWRLVAMGQLTRAMARAVPESALRNNGGVSDEVEAPPLFSLPFMEVVANAIDQGYLSVRRAAVLTGLAIEDLQNLFEAHGLEFAIEQ